MRPPFRPATGKSQIFKDAYFGWCVICRDQPHAVFYATSFTAALTMLGLT